MPYEQFDLAGKSVLVTGGNSGIGLGMAEAVAEAGADVCVWGRNKERNQTSLEKLKGYGAKALALECDVSNQENEKFKKSIMPRIPQRRWGEPKDFGPIAVYFCSEASSYHTGDALTIDGG